MTKHRITCLCILTLTCSFIDRSLGQVTVANSVGTGMAGTQANPATYQLSVTVPGGLTVTGISATYSFAAGNGCNAGDGFFRFRLGTCTNGDWTCDPAGGNCGNAGTVSGTVPVNNLVGCVPQPTCQPYALNFSLELWSTGGACVVGGTWTMTLTCEPLAITSISADQTSCELSGIPAYLSATHTYGVPPVSYVWNPGNLVGQSQSFIPTQSQAYTVTVTDQCGATASDNTTITLIPFYNPGFNIDPNPVCDGQAALLTASGGTMNPQDYDWYMPYSAQPNTNGTTSTTVTYDLGSTQTEVRQIFMDYHTQGCTFRSAQNIAIKPTLTATVDVLANTTGVICPGSVLGFTAQTTNQGLSPIYQWQVNGMNVGTDDPVFASNLLNDGDQVSVLMYSSEQCLDTNVVESPTYTVSVYPTLLATTSLDEIICEGESVPINAIGQGGNPDYQYTWQPGNLIGPYHVVDPTSTTGYTVTVTDDCSQQISNTVNIVVIENSNPGFTILAEPYCPDNEIWFIGLGTNDSTQYNWYAPGADNEYSYMTLSDTVTYPYPGDYSVTLNFQDGNCTFPLTQYFTVEPWHTPEVLLSFSPFPPICSGDTVFFMALDQSNGQANLYEWLINGTLNYIGGPDFQTTLLTSTDEVSVVMIPGENCLTQPNDTSNVVMVPVFDPLEVTAYSDTVVCPDFPIPLFVAATGGSGAGTYSYVWHTTQFDTVGSGELIVVPAEAMDYVVSVRDNCPFDAVRDTVTVTVLPKPHSLFTVDPDSLIVAEGSFHFTNLSQGFEEWTWDLGDGTADTSFSPIYSYSDSGFYTVTLVTINEWNCTDTARKVIRVNDRVTYYLPNAFTPNNDRLNETFGLIGHGFDAGGPYAMRIYNRWGSCIYQTDTGIAWDGRDPRTGTPYPEDLYAYEITVFDQKSYRFQELKGTVVLLH